MTVSNLHSASNLNCVEIIFPLRLGIFSNHDPIMNSLLTDDTYYIICIYIGKVHFNYSTGHPVLISVEIERPILKCIGSSQCMILKKVRCLLICDPEYCAMKNVFLDRTVLYLYSFILNYFNKKYHSEINHFITSLCSIPLSSNRSPIGILWWWWCIRLELNASQFRFIFKLTLLMVPSLFFEFLFGSLPVVGVEIGLELVENHY